MKTITIDVIKGTADVHAVEGDVGVKVIITNTPQEWKNCTVFALLTQGSESQHIKIVDDTFKIPSAFTDANKAFKFGVYAVGADGSRDVRPSIWIRVESSDFTTDDIEITLQNIGDILDLQAQYTKCEKAEEARVKAEEVRQANESARIEAENNRKTELAVIKTRLSDVETDIDNLEDGKVDKIDGKDLSTNDYTDYDAMKLSEIEYGAQKNLPVDQTYKSDSANAQSGKAVAEAIAKLVGTAPESLDTIQELAEALGNNADVVDVLNSAIANKVDKVNGYQLSQNNFSDNERLKLIGIEDNAQKNVQSDWNEENESSDAFIKNKPDMGRFVQKDFPDLTNARDTTFANDLLGEGYGTTVYYGVKGGWNYYMLTVIKTSEDTVRYIQYGFLNSDGSVFNSDVCALKYRYGVYESYEDYETGETHYYINWSSWAEFLTEETVKKILYPKPISRVHNPLRKNTSYNFGEVSDLNLKFPGSYASNDGDVIYLTFTSGSDATTLSIETTNTSDIDLVPEPNAGYEIYAKYNGEIWILGYSEYTIAKGDAV